MLMDHVPFQDGPVSTANLFTAKFVYKKNDSSRPHPVFVDFMFKSGDGVYGC